MNEEFDEMTAPMRAVVAGGTARGSAVRTLVSFCSAAIVAALIGCGKQPERKPDFKGVYGGYDSKAPGTEIKK